MWLLKAAGNKVWLEKAVSKTDRYGRLLRYAWLHAGAKSMLNERLVQEGYAQVSTYPPDVKYQERFLAAQRAARSAGRGLWGACGAVVTPTKPKAAATVTKQAAKPQPTKAAAPGLRYDPNGPDRDCGDFATHAQTQAFFLAASGPEREPHRLDSDYDGFACASLP